MIFTKRRISITHIVLAAAVASMVFACDSSGGGGGGGEGKGADSPTSDTSSHPLVGQPAPDFSVTATSGGSVSTGKLRGKVVVVDFWATWCEPCKKSFPKLQELNVKYKASGLEVVGISEDDDKKGISDFGATYGAKFPLGWDEDKAIAGKWQVKSMPNSFIIDRKGIVRFVHGGFHDGDEVEYERQIKSLL